MNSPRVATATHGVVELTRWGVNLADSAQERRFRDYIVHSERRAVLAITAAAFAINIALVMSNAISHSSITTHMIVTQAVIVPLFAITTWLLLGSRSKHLIVRTYIAVLLSCGIVALMVTRGHHMATVAAVLLITGIVLIYLTGRISLIGVTIDAVFFTGVMLVAGLATRPAPSTSDIATIMTIAALVHVLGFFEARRAQGERRVLFAQRELLARLSQTDELTGLTNRRAMREFLSDQWAHWHDNREQFAVMMFDIDRFKLFNDAFGHPAGDAALRDVADAIAETLDSGRGQIASRYGGEEFVCLLPRAGIGEARAVAEHIQHAVRELTMQRATSDNAPISPLTVSGGIAAVSPSITDLDHLMQLVDDRLYAAKAAGRDCVRV